MRSWKPRGPSPRIKARLFPSPTPAPAGPEPPISALWAWLAPALAIWLFTALVLPKEARGFGNWQTGQPTGLVAAVALDSPQLVTYVQSKRHSIWNAWPAASFEWTNDTVSQTTAPPFLRTNALMQ